MHLLKYRVNWAKYTIFYFNLKVYFLIIITENNKSIIKDYFWSKLTIILDDNNIAWFKGCDVAKILGYVDKKKAVRKNVDLDDKLKLNELVWVFKDAPLNSQPHTIYINESGIYSLVFGSKMENAKKFKDGLQMK